MQHGSHINISLQFFSSNEPCRKTAVQEAVDAEINNVIYMELYSGAKMTDGKYLKTYVAGSVDRENTVPH
jgi:hypothetical protein